MRGYYGNDEISDASAVRRSHHYDPVRRPGPTSGAGGSRLILIKYTDLDAALGPRDSGGIQFEGDCEVYDHLVTGVATPSPIVEGTANGTYSVGIVLPGQFAWARYTNGKYWVQSGSMYLEGITQEDIVSGGSGDVLFSDDGIEDVTIEVASRCSKTIVSGTTVGVGVRPFIGGSPNQCQLRIIWECCPAVEDD